jgi:Outer membrane protein beta-barrel domain
MNKIKYFILFIFILFLSGKSFGQAGDTSSCAQNLLDAQSLFAAGKLNLVPGKIEQCLKEGFTKPEKVTAYKLLSVTYTYLQEFDKADQAVLNLLKLEKEYKVNPEIDPTEFIKLYQKFRTYPIFQFGIKVGVNNPWLIFGNTYESTSDPAGNAGYYKILNGMNAGLEFEIPIRKLSENLEVCPSLIYSTKSFNILDSLTDQYKTASIGNFQGTESQTWIELPVMVRYIFHINNLKPFVELGPSVNYLMKASINKPITQSPVQSPKSADIDIRDQLNQWNYAAQIGCGIKFDIPMAEVVLKANFNYALNKLYVRQNPPTTSEINTEYLGYQPVDYRINYFSFTIGYMRKMYKPKKIFQ